MQLRFENALSRPYCISIDKIHINYSNEQSIERKDVGRRSHVVPLKKTLGKRKDIFTYLLIIKGL